MEKGPTIENSTEDDLFSALLEEIKSNIKDNLRCVDMYQVRLSQIMDFIGWAKRNHGVKIPDNMEGVFNKMYFFLKNNQTEEALNFMNKVLDIGDNKVYMVLKCFLLLKLERPHDAMEFIDYVLDSKNQAFSLDQSFIDRQVKVLYATGKEFLLLKKYEDALVYFDECTKLTDNNIEVIYDKGMCLLTLGKYNEALVCFDEILEIDPDSIQAIGAKKRTLVIMNIKMRRGNNL